MHQSGRPADAQTDAGTLRLEGDPPAQRADDPRLLGTEQLVPQRIEQRGALEAAKREQDWIESLIARRYAGRGAEARRSAGKETDTIRLSDGEAEIVADRPETVRSNQPKLAEVVATLRESGDDPADDVATDLRVPEAGSSASPWRIRALFAPARTVAAGHPPYSLARKVSA